MNKKIDFKILVKYFFMFLILVFLFSMYTNSIFDVDFTCETGLCYVCSDNNIKNNSEFLSFYSYLDKPAIVLDTSECKELSLGESVRIASYNTILTYYFLAISTFLLILGFFIILFL